RRWLRTLLTSMPRSSAMRGAPTFVHPDLLAYVHKSARTRKAAWLTSGSRTASVGTIPNVGPFWLLDWVTRASPSCLWRGQGGGVATALRAVVSRLGVLLGRLRVAFPCEVREVEALRRSCPTLTVALVERPVGVDLREPVVEARRGRTAGDAGDGPHVASSRGSQSATTAERTEVGRRAHAGSSSTNRSSTWTSRSAATAP